MTEILITTLTFICTFQTLKKKYIKYNENLSIIIDGKF